MLREARERVKSMQDSPVAKFPSARERTRAIFRKAGKASPPPVNSLASGMHPAERFW